MAMMRLKTRCGITLGFLLLTTGVPAQVAATKPADPLLEGFRHPSAERAPAGPVALDEWKHQPRGHPARPRMVQILRESTKEP